MSPLRDPNTNRFVPLMIGRYDRFVEKEKRVRTSIARTLQAAMPRTGPAAGQSRAAAKRRLHNLTVQRMCHEP